MMQRRLLRSGLAHPVLVLLALARIICGARSLIRLSGAEAGARVDARRIDGIAARVYSPVGEALGRWWRSPMASPARSS
jgi:hypothetical protein